MQKTRLTVFTAFIIICKLLMAFAIRAEAATLTAASPSYADVQSMIAAAARGDTVNVPAGSATWTQTLVITKGIHLQGAGRDSTFITCNTIAVEIRPDATAIANEEVIRVTGFTFDGNNAAAFILHVIGAWSNGTKPFKNLAIGNNRIRNAKPQTSSAAAIWTQGQVRGVIYGNAFDRVNVVLKVLGSNDSGQEWLNPAYYPFAYGNSDNLFFENNTIGWSSPNPVDGSNGWIESGQGGRIVVRYNSYNMANSDATELWDIHGFQNWPGNGQTGTMIVEYYGNTISNFNGFRWANHRGSWGLFHNNILTGSGGASINMSQYGPGDIGGSGLTAAVPGATGHYICEINNTYIFNNTKNGSIVNASRGTVGASSGVNENSHWWNYNPTFNGTTGIGRGTTPPSGNCAVGVAYWAASSPTPTTDPTIIQSGTLYKCLSPNVWTAYYTPFTYPHPLRSGSLANSNVPIITTASTGGGTVGVPFSYQITASNNPTSFGATGLPPGVTVNGASGLITGTPTAGGVYSVGLNATNANGTGSVVLQVTINGSAGSPTITSSGTAAGTVGSPFNYEVLAGNNSTSYGAAGLPIGLIMNNATGAITGTPSIAGVYSVGLSATNTSGTGSAILVITVAAANPIVAEVPITTPFAPSQGVITGPFVVSGSTISQPVTTTDPAQGGKAVYTFNITRPGSYYLIALANAPDDGSNSFFINIDAEPTAPGMIWQIPLTSGFESRPVNWSGGMTHQIWDLSAGNHQLIIRGREAGAILGSVSIIRRLDSPKNLTRVN